MKFVEMIAKLPGSVSCLLVKGKDMLGEPMFAYVAIADNQMEKFKKMAKLGQFHPEKMSKIIYAGMGALTPELHKKIIDAYIAEAGVVIF